ncbi:exodeoxyribonuclease III [Caproiciproducens galactitolivorans]|uniref:Exodeoxyribonuclease n=1 Tax=Caproiciproducens galactitolivorans TaxID=642589 RepID=A0A4Z0Y9V2_9FIRM|nr:exodeoxyribonuclease III [Caproiciproducens galactitolivorans]QEY33797.1 exodeoxyribonuclease III [Caproiciproducens galactitolivorans]TGJ75623.1 exodeoxyribonuclease [Caproiciproducens galactitolivorans]
MKFYSWNVNGLRACMNKGFLDFFRSADADAVCLQETKMQPDQAEIPLPGYRQYWNSAVKKGYSGTAIFTRLEPLSVSYDIQAEEHVGEGRSITLEFEEYYLVTVYTPNAQRDLARLDYRMRWEDAFRSYLQQLNAKKPVIVCGDMNVAHNEIDLKNPKSNRGNAGFTDQERAKMTELLASGFTDSFRYLHPDEKDAYTWWSYMFKAREKNIGWRIDYFLVSNGIQNRICESNIHPEVMGSDHCPIELVLS